MAPDCATMVPAATVGVNYALDRGCFSFLLLPGQSLAFRGHY